VSWQSTSNKIVSLSLLAWHSKPLLELLVGLIRVLSNQFYLGVLLVVVELNQATYLYLIVDLRKVACMLSILELRRASVRQFARALLLAR